MALGRGLGLVSRNLLVSGLLGAVCIILDETASNLGRRSCQGVSDPFGGLGRWTPLVLAVRLGVDWKRYRIDSPVDRKGGFGPYPEV